jgi:hypothetical protein
MGVYVLQNLGVNILTNLGICGAHRTGKTTLAIALSQKLGIPFVSIDASSVFLQHGYHPSQSFDVRTRLFLQEKILEQAESIWFEVDESSFICDRTPIDMAAYMLTDVSNSELDQHTQDEIMSYLGECFRITKQYFDKLVLVPPAIPFIPAHDKAAINEPLIFKLHYGISGMLSALDVDYRKLPNDCIELSDRVEFVEKFWREN